MGGPGRCLSLPIAVAVASLAFIDGAIAVLAFLQLLRMHLRRPQLGWTRQKIFRLMIGSCNIGFVGYFVITLLATCQGWQCWSHGCGFVLMACPQILFLAAFLLLLSFWVDLCHQANDEDEEDDGCSYNEALLDKSTNKPRVLPVDVHRRCCSFQAIRVGSRQKFVILVIVLTFLFMLAFAVLIWVGKGTNPIDSSLLTRVYLSIFSVAILLLGVALAYYGLLLFSKMSKVRSEMVSTEKWKVASLAIASVICFTSSAILALVTSVPVGSCFYLVVSYWYSSHCNIISSSVLIFLYYLLGSSVPSALVLWLMREMPSRPTVDRPVQSRNVTFIRDGATSAQNPPWRTAVTSSQPKVNKASPI